MPIETLTYSALGARLRISAQAARSLAKRLGLPRSVSDDGKALVSVDLAEIRHAPRPGRRRGADKAASLKAKIAGLEANIARLELAAAGHRADFEHERERADRLLIELLQANTETTAAKEAAARLEGALRTSSRHAGPADSPAQAQHRLGRLAADLVAGDRKASG
ncbi:MAG TPA: hypothetical protein VMM15_11210 [Bradyrhizobium sp.]|nr:hypothetical protein [Bradyrhizobium sp.]